MDSNRAGNIANRRSHYAIIIYINNEPIIWYSKHQNITDASSFGSEFVVPSIKKYIIDVLWYKLSCFGVPVDGVADI